VQEAQMMTMDAKLQKHIYYNNQPNYIDFTIHKMVVNLTYHAGEYHHMHVTKFPYKTPAFKGTDST
jgi:hypothetical protein